MVEHVLARSFLLCLALVSLSGASPKAEGTSPVAPKKIRKQVYDLTAADLEAYPIWENCLDEEGLDGQDEATVRPWLESRTSVPRHGGLFVRATFTARDGTRFTGYFKPDAWDKPGYLQPTIITPAGQVNFWSGLAKPTRTQLRRAYERLGKRPEELFPLVFKSELTVPDGWSAGGTIPGFRGLVRLGRDELFEVR